MSRRFLVGMLGLVLLAVAPAHANADAGEGPPPSPAVANPWKPVFVSSAAVTMVLLGVAAYASVSVRGEADQIDAVAITGSTTITEEDCDAPANIIDDRGGHFAAACRWRSRGKTATYFGLGFGALTLATAYLAFFDRAQPRDDARVTVTPVVSPDGAGAAMRVRW